MQAVDGVLGNRWPNGTYRAYGETSAIAPAANGIMAAFRFADVQGIANIIRVWVNVTVVTAVTAQRTDPLRLFFARAYIVRDATNATAIAISTLMQKLRTGMGDSKLIAAAGGNFDVASAAAGVTGGTKTVDTTPIGSKGFGNGPALVGLGTGMEGDIFNLAAQGSHPISLAPQPSTTGAGEGVLVQWGGTTLATGTVTVGVGVEWAESSRS